MLLAAGVLALAACATDPSEFSRRKRSQNTVPIHKGPRAPVSQEITVLEPWETVDLEHEDRKARLLRLDRGRLAPEFYTHFVMPDEHGIGVLPTRIPVLRVVFDQSVFFDFDKAALRPASGPVLDLVAENLRREPPDVALFVAGHTDSKGSDDYNFALGLRRAEVVAAALVRRGVNLSSVYRVSFGESVPRASNAVEMGRERNRRVEFLFAAHRKAVVTWLERQPVEACSKTADGILRGCRERVSFEARRLTLEPHARERLADLDRQEKALSLDRNRSESEVAAKRAEIQLQRQRVPISLSRERIAIELRRSENP